MQINLEREQDNLKKRHNEVLSNLQKEFESEKHTRKQKFDMQISKYMKSGQNLDELNEDEEKKEIAVIFINDFHINIESYFKIKLFNVLLN